MHALVRWSHKLLSPTRRVNQHRGHSLVSAPTKSLRHTIGNVNNTKRVAATLGQSGGSVPIRLATGRVRAVPAGGTSIRNWSRSNERPKLVSTNTATRAPFRLRSRCGSRPRCRSGRRRRSSSALTCSHGPDPAGCLHPDRGRNRTTQVADGCRVGDSDRAAGGDRDERRPGIDGRLAPPAPVAGRRATATRASVSPRPARPRSTTAAMSAANSCTRPDSR